MKHIHRTKKQKGFTLIETLAAIFILLVSIAGPLSSAQSGLRSSFLARDQIIAFYLAQDAVESIKHLRDNYALEKGPIDDWLPTDDWLAALGACNPSVLRTPVECKIDTAPNDAFSITSCTGSCDGQLYYDDSERKYTHQLGSGNSLSKYSRKVYVTEIVTGKEAQVLVEITWDSNYFSDRRVIIQENIYNWIPTYLN